MTRPLTETLPAEARLEDPFRRRINYLRVSITDRCNLRCAYCMPEEGVPALPHQDILSYEEILRLVRIALGLGIRKVRVTGGEPLVRKGVTGFIADLSKLPGLDDLSLTTNGILLGPKAEELARAGLKRVNVSLDTLRPEAYQRITRFDGLSEVLSGIRAAKQAGLNPVKINVVAMRGVNDGEILDFARFAEENDLEVRFIEYMPSRLETWTQAKLLPAEEILATIRTRYDLVDVAETAPSCGPGRIFDLPRGGRVGVISALSEHFCDRCNRLRLTADGRLRSCLFSSRETDIRTLLRTGASDSELSALFLEAVREKPSGHRLNDPDDPKSALSMSRIGG
jgi:cyclic pyranopterin phosphate synthase